MKRRQLMSAMAFVASVVIVFHIGITVGAKSNSLEPGTAADPLITKSYLDERLKGQNGQGTSSTVGYEKVILSKDDVLDLADGTELILYSGNANVVGNSELINLSTGELFKQGNTVVKYHVFLSTSCKIKATGQVTAYVRGTYKK